MPLTWQYLCRIVSGDNNFLMDLEGVHERLKERGATDDLCSYVEDLLMNQHQRYHNFMTAEADKRRLLLEHLHKLEVCMLALKSFCLGMPCCTPCPTVCCMPVVVEHPANNNVIWLSWFLQNDKRHLETAMVVESRISNKNRTVSRRSLGDTTDGMEQSEVRPSTLLWLDQL